MVLLLLVGWFWLVSDGCMTAMSAVFPCCWLLAFLVPFRRLIGHGLGVDGFGFLAKCPPPQGDPLEFRGVRGAFRTYPMQ